MANKKIEAGSSHSARIGCRLTDEEHARLKQEAEIHGCTLSQLVRSKVVGSVLLSKIEAKTILELRRQGGLLKHLIMSHPEAIDAGQVRKTLHEITETIMRISEGGKS